MEEGSGWTSEEVRCWRAARRDMVIVIVRFNRDRGRSRWCPAPRADGDGEKTRDGRMIEN